MPSRKDFFNAIKDEYPNLTDEMINVVLDLNETHPDYISDIIKNERKLSKSKSIPKAKRQINLEELDMLTKKFKEQEINILKTNVAKIISFDN